MHSVSGPARGCRRAHLSLQFYHCFDRRQQAAGHLVRSCLNVSSYMSLWPVSQCGVSSNGARSRAVTVPLTPSSLIKGFLRVIRKQSRRCRMSSCHSDCLSLLIICCYIRCLLISGHAERSHHCTCTSKLPQCQRGSTASMSFRRLAERLRIRFRRRLRSEATQRFVHGQKRSRSNLNSSIEQLRSDFDSQWKFASMYVVHRSEGRAWHMESMRNQREAI